MQSRIMELASQREFYIATNTRLHLTLTEHDLSSSSSAGGNKVSNGAQTQGDGPLLRGQQSAILSSTQCSVGSPQHISEPATTKPTASLTQVNLDLSNGMETAYRVQGRLPLCQGGTLANLELFSASTVSATGGRVVRGTPDVTNVTDSIHTPISTFAALPVGNTHQWCN